MGVFKEVHDHPHGHSSVAQPAPFPGSCCYSKSKHMASTHQKLLVSWGLAATGQSAPGAQRKICWRLTGAILYKTSMAADKDVAKSLKVWQLLWGNFAWKTNKVITRRGSMAPSGAHPGYLQVFHPAGHTSPGRSEACSGPPATSGTSTGSLLAAFPSCVLLSCLGISFSFLLPSYSFYPVKL